MQKEAGMSEVHSHNQYCVTWRNKHNILCRVCDVVAVVTLFGTAYVVMSVAAILDLIVAGGQ